jgi:hypothetical protein
MTTLRVLVDGEAMPGEEGIAFWKRFSTWMEEHAGDLAGFAKSEGLASVHPEMHGGAPVLVASRTAAQKPYTSAPKKPERGSVGAQPRGRGGDPVGSHPGSRAVHAGGPRNGAPRKSKGR